MNDEPTFKLSTYSLITFAAAFVVGMCFVVSITNYQIRQEAIKEATQDAQAILRQNDAINSYFAFKLRPHIFKYVAKDLDPDYFGPVWMSAGYAVRNIFKDSKAENGISFKISSPNARTEEFVATPLELDIIKAFENDPSLKEYATINKIDGEQCLTVMRPGQVLAPRCMRCHSSPDIAPAGLIKEYGPIKGFNRKPGSLSSAFTVTVPLGPAFEAANIVSLKLSGLLTLIMGIMLATIYIFNKRFIIRPIATLTRRMEMISDNDTLLGEHLIPEGSVEFHKLAHSFNTLSDKLKTTLDQQEEIIDKRTQEVSTSRARFRAMFEHMQNGVAVFDPIDEGNDFIFVDFNAAGEKIEGVSRTHLIGAKLTEAFPSVKGSALMRVLKEVWETGIPAHLPPTLLLESRNGWRESFVFKLETNEIISVYSDVTEKEEARLELLHAKEAAESANQAKGEFLANMSHEIRTPLNGIFGLLQLLKKSGLEDDQLEYVNLALSTGNGLLQIINDVLDFSRLEQNGLTIASEPFDPREPMQLITKSFEVTLKNKNVQLETFIDDGIPKVLIGDSGRLRQILFNLVGNAAKFTDQGYVHVSMFPIRQEDGSILIGCEIEDTGSGISENKINDIFSPFVQGDQSMTKRFQGTGLGLGIVRKLVGLMDGSIAVVSNEGEGTTFLFTFKADIGMAKTCLEPFSSQLETITPCHILVAEDDNVNRLCLSRFLEKMGHTYMLAKDGEQALALLRKNTFDGVLMDIQMPNLSGVEATNMIRSGIDKQLPKDIPIIALTAFTMAGDRERFLAAGMTSYLMKPVNMESLQRSIAHYFVHNADPKCN